MFMTVLKIDFESLQNRAYLMKVDDGDFMHKWLTSQFDCERRDKNILYRVDKTESAIYLYVQSDSEFPKHNLKNAGISFVKEFEVSANSESRIYFNIRCFPVKSNNNKRVYLKNSDHRLDFIKSRLSQFMSIENISETNVSNRTIKGGICVTSSDFSGYGRITDVEKFNERIRSGIGKCKNYGMGLMLFREM